MKKWQPQHEDETQGKVAKKGLAHTGTISGQVTEPADRKGLIHTLYT